MRDKTKIKYYETNYTELPNLNKMREKIKEILTELVEKPYRKEICLNKIMEIKIENQEGMFIKFFQEATVINESIGKQAFHIIGFYRRFAEKYLNKK